MAAPKPYANPYLAGTGLGLVLLAAFVVAGRGLGASGAFIRASEHLRGSGGPWFDWIVVEIMECGRSHRPKPRAAIDDGRG